MQHIDTIVIGGGQAGLAMSHELTTVGHDHVVLEQHQIGARWRRETWDSLHLLTPNWMNVLPGSTPTGPDPDGFATANGFADHLDRYAVSFGAPIQQGITVEVVRRRGAAFEVATSGGTWLAGNVVVATGWCDQPVVPAMAGSLDVEQLSPGRYRRPDDLPAGGVLVVGASATGAQLAAELRRAGRDVTLAVGSHTRVPRTYRGMDIFWWLQRIGALDRTLDTMPDHRAARREPSLQVIGGDYPGAVDLPSLHDAGVHLTGRLTATAGTTVSFADDLAATTAEADRRLATLLRRIDATITTAGLEREVLPAEPVRPLDPSDAVTDLDLRAADVSTVIWATGHRRSYPWLHVPVLDPHGEIQHTRGITPVPGLYVLGQRFQHRRSSNFIAGVGADTTFVAAHLVEHRTPSCPTHQELHHAHH